MKLDGSDCPELQAYPEQIRREMIGRVIVEIERRSVFFRWGVPAVVGFLASAWLLSLVGVPVALTAAVGTGVFLFFFAIGVERLKRRILRQSVDEWAVELDAVAPHN